ncbi:MAG: putative porin, partial [Bacteroidota bacterium]
QALFQNHLDLKVGIRGKFFTSNLGEQYNPETMIYVENPFPELSPHGSADLFLVGKVGSAYFHFLLENITDERYMLTPYFPMQDRKIRFGVEWEFLD